MHDRLRTRQPCAIIAVVGSAEQSAALDHETTQRAPDSAAAFAGPYQISWA